MLTPAARRWGPIVRRARQSGTSIRAYARQHGINQSTLSWWSWRLGEDPAAPAFVELTLDDAPPPLRLLLRGATLEVDAHTDLRLLRRVVEALS